MCGPPPLRSELLYTKDGECAESNEKSSFRFLVFELLAAKDQRATHSDSIFFSNVAKFTGKIGIDLTTILYFPICNKFRTWQKFETCFTLL